MQNLRVISGTARGHTLKTLKGQMTRPTLERVREAIFNVLAKHVPGANVLDLFAGSGALGIEALSRGAAKCIFNDLNKQAKQVIIANIRFTKLESKAVVYSLDAEKLLDILQKEAQVFDLVFVDPPYQSGLYERILEKLVSNGLLKQDAIIVAECDSNVIIEPQDDRLCLFKKSRYGDSQVWYYKFMGE